MDFALSPEQRKAIADATEAAMRLAPLPACDSRAFWQVAGDAGWLGLCLPTSRGGGGLGALEAALVFEALGAAGVTRSALFAMGAHLFGVAMPLSSFPTPQADRWLPALASGTATGALALSEPSGGSDLSGLTTTAQKTDGGWLLEGAKTYVSNGPCADVMLVSARHPDIQSAAFSTSVFVVPRDAPGLSVTPITGPIGLAGAPMATVTLQGVRVGSDDLLGRQGQGLAAILSAMRWERSCILSGFLGAAEHDLSACLQFFRTRDAGKSRHQAVDLAFADMHAKLSSARWSLYHGAWAVDHQGDPVKDPAITKAVVSRILAEVARDLQELAAGPGWCDTLGLATAVADTMGILTASGTTTTQLRAIATRMGR